MLFSLLQLLMLLGAFQGFIFSGFAFFSAKYKSRSNFFLGMLILTFSYNIIQNYLAVSEILNLDYYFNYYYIPCAPLFMVLFYLYVFSYLYPEKPLKRIHYVLFIPFLISFSEAVMEKIGFATGFFNESNEDSFYQFRIGFEIFNVAYSFILIVFSYLLISKFQKEGNSKIGVNWLKMVTIVLFFLILYWPIPLYINADLSFQDAEPYFYVLWIGLSVTIYALGHIGLHQFGIAVEQKNIQKFSAGQVVLQTEPGHFKNEYIVAIEDYIKTQKKFLDPSISLDSVAESLNLNRSYLSRIINAELNKSFTEYVNELRVEEAKVFMNNPKFQNYTLISIGLEAGFSSKSNFYAVFKKFTGQTPAEYKAQLAEK